MLEPNLEIAWRHRGNGEKEGKAETQSRMRAEKDTVCAHAAFWYVGYAPNGIRKMGQQNSRRGGTRMIAKTKKECEENEERKAKRGPQVMGRQRPERGTESKKTNRKETHIQRIFIQMMMFALSSTHDSRLLTCRRNRRALALRAFRPLHVLPRCLLAGREAARTTLTDTRITLGRCTASLTRGRLHGQVVVGRAVLRRIEGGIGMGVGIRGVRSRAG